MLIHGSLNIGVCNTTTLQSLPLEGKPLATHLDVHQPFQQYGGTCSFGSSAETYLIPLPSLHCGEGSSFPGSAESNDTVNSESVVGVKPGNYCVVIGYQVDEFTCTWLAEHLITWSNIYLGFMDKASNPFPSWTVRIVPFWTRQLSQLGMVLILTSRTLWTHQYWMHPLMIHSSGFSTMYCFWYF